MNDELFAAAVQRFLLEPESLTAEEIAELACIDAQLGERALRKRKDASVKAAEARHRAAMGEPPLKTKAAETFADNVLDVIAAHLAKPRSRIKALESQCETLEARLLELEAQRAVDHVAR